MKMQVFPRNFSIYSFLYGIYSCCIFHLPLRERKKPPRLPLSETEAVRLLYGCFFRHSMPTNWHSVFEILVISVFRGLSVHLPERFFQADHRFFDDFCIIRGTICKLFGHPAVEHRLCLFDLNAQQFICLTVQCVDDVDQRFQAGNRVACFDMTDVRDHHADLIGQLLLRHALCKAAGTDAFSDIGVVHHSTSTLRSMKWYLYCMCNRFRI